MKRTIILKSPEQFKSALNALDSIPKDEVHELEIRPHRANLSARQRGLYYTWIPIISMSTGQSKEEVHLRLKGRFLVPIFEREKEWYRVLLESIRVVYQNGDRSTAMMQYKAVLRLTSIRDANTKEFSDYMEDCRMSVQEDLSICLPLPEDERDETRKTKKV